MELFLVTVPLFDKYKSTEAYLFRYQLANQGAEEDTQDASPALEAVNAAGAEAFAGSKSILVPVTTDMLGFLAENCTHSPERTTFLLSDFTRLDGEPRLSMNALWQKGYHFAAFQTDAYIDDADLLKKCDFVLFGPNPMNHSERRPMVVRYTRYYRSIRTVATGLASPEAYAKAEEDGFHLFEGSFYRVPAAVHGRGLTPIKANLIRLLNLVRDDSFEFSDVAAIIRQDTALTYSLIRFINSPYLGIKYKVKSIQQAVTILGQVEVRKWITAAVVRALGSDRPDELTRLSLIRAKFAENLASILGMERDASSLFLAGLFSILDAMLEIPMKDALEQVMVSDEIALALVEGGGRFFPVLEYVIRYENADWVSVAAFNSARAIPVASVYKAYIDAVGWYGDLLSTRIQEPRTYPTIRRPSRRSDW